MFLNLSNHPSANWSAEQKSAAETVGGAIVDLPFPIVDPAGDVDYISSLADEYLCRILEMSDGEDVTVHLMGEMTLTFALIQRLLAEDIPCVASTTERNTIMATGGKKISEFRFVQFREY